MAEIIRNLAQCRNCLSVIESLHVHDLQTCDCGNLSVDGGREYLRRVCTHEDDLIELSKMSESDRPIV